MSTIGICGIGGRMGRAILRIAMENGHRLGAAFEYPESPLLGTDAAQLVVGDRSGITITPIDEGAVSRVDGIIDFSTPGAGMQLLDHARKYGKPLVIGTTGFSEAELEKIKSAAADMPVLISPNMSLGVNLLFKLTEICSRALDARYDIEVFESHHRNKKDAPSGTARHLVDIIKKSLPALNDAVEVTGRNGMVGARTDHEIGVLALRGGDIIGEHTVYFIGMEERIELTHRAANRDALARGAVFALEFLVNKKQGLFTMNDVLGI